MDGFLPQRKDNDIHLWIILSRRAGKGRLKGLLIAKIGQQERYLMCFAGSLLFAVRIGQLFCGQQDIAQQSPFAAPYLRIGKRPFLARRRNPCRLAMRQRRTNHFLTC